MSTYGRIVRLVETRGDKGHCDRGFEEHKQFHPEEYTFRSVGGVPIPYKERGNIPKHIHSKGE